MREWNIIKGRFRKFIRPDITVTPERTCHAALVEVVRKCAGSIISIVDGIATRQKGMGLGGPAVILKRPQVGIRGIGGSAAFMTCRTITFNQVV